MSYGVGVCYGVGVGYGVGLYTIAVLMYRIDVQFSFSFPHK